MMKRPLHQKMA